MNEVNEVREWHVRRSRKADISFKGTLLAEVSSHDGREDCRNWVVFRLYRSVGGKYVSERRWCHLPVTKQEESVDGTVCSERWEVTRYFGFGPLAKKLYKLSDFDDSIRVP